MRNLVPIALLLSLLLPTLPAAAVGTAGPGDALPSPAVWAQGEEPVPGRIAPDGSGSDPVQQAVAISRETFLDGQAPFGVIATATRYPDALGGASLSRGNAPLLFSGADGALSPETLAELERVVVPGAEIRVLGGTAAVPTRVDEQLVERGFTVRRLAGSGREATAVAVAAEVVAAAGGLPQDTVIVATGANWPDAVTFGQIGSSWGIPVLLTPADALNGDTAAALADLDPGRVLVGGGDAAITDATVAEIEAITGPGSTVRLGGSTRFGTAASITRYNTDQLYTRFAPAYVVAVNLRRDADAFAHVLAASMLTGQFSGVYAPVEGDGGTDVPAEVRDAICGLGVPVVAVGGTDLVADAAVAAIRDASAGIGCADRRPAGLGDALVSAVIEELPVRTFTYAGTAGEALRIRMDALATEGAALDPVVSVLDPAGQLVDSNDDSFEGGANALLEVVLPVDGTYTIRAESSTAARGGFLLSVNPAPAYEDSGTLTRGQATATYPFEAPAGARIVVEMRAVAGEATDPSLLAYGGDGELIASDDDGGVFPNARMSFLAPGGPIDIVATAFSDRYGDYTLAVYAPDAEITFG